MNLTILNTLPQISRCFPDGQFNRSAWRDYEPDISPDIVTYCENDTRKYHFDEAVLPVLQDTFTNNIKRDLLNQSFRSVMKTLSQHADLLFEKDAAVTVILYLGLCNAAGHVTELNNHNTILLGIEKILELNWHTEPQCAVLFFTNWGISGMISMENYTFQSIASGNSQLLQLYQEGIATVCEQILCQNDHYYHQDQNGHWLDWCMDHETTIKYEYLRRLNANESTQDFFGDWCSYMGHSDVGYFLGCQFVKHLLLTYPLPENISLRKIANLPYSVLNVEFVKFVSFSY